MFPNINENMKTPMTRREALKRMGAFAALLSLELTGVSAGKPRRGCPLRPRLI